MIISDYSHYIGSAGAVMTTISFVPQVIHSYRTRDLSGVSLSMYSIFTLGVGLWLLYGVLKHDWPLIVANSITFCLAAIVLVLKIQQSNKK
ncbi:SemiSWEET transporter [Methylotenera sp. N17]|jgi:MtN3 and saliva related transmembrane protein|uniref:SemiSWEET transporter n=1 Tax=Methylotenera sp. N17 TaxID=1502761 RepID=UPI0006491873|nr:SemiSWEET transporter [Methylotenera sp. N17]